MTQWCRVFGQAEAEPDPDRLTREVARAAPEAVVAWQQSERGWCRAEVRVDPSRPPLVLERFWRDEEGIRGELQAWAAWLETCDYSPHHEPLMRHLIQTQQVFTLRRPVDWPNEALLDALCDVLSQALAQEADGVYQIDGRGFFAPDGALLLEEY
jgi:hypothetical protein